MLLTHVEVVDTYVLQIGLAASSCLCLAVGGACAGATTCINAAADEDLRARYFRRFDGGAEALLISRKHGAEKVSVSDAKGQGGQLRRCGVVVYLKSERDDRERQSARAHRFSAGADGHLNLVGSAWLARTRCSASLRPHPRAASGPQPVPNHRHKRAAW